MKSQMSSTLEWKGEFVFCPIDDTAYGWSPVDVLEIESSCGSGAAVKLHQKAQYPVVSSVFDTSQ